MKALGLFCRLILEQQRASLFDVEHNPLCAAEGDGITRAGAAQYLLLGEGLLGFTVLIVAQLLKMGDGLLIALGFHMLLRQLVAALFGQGFAVPIVLQAAEN